MPKISSIEAYFPKEIEKVYEETRKNAASKKVIAGLVALSLIVLLLVVFVILPRADVTVYAKKQPITRDLPIIISAAAKEIDSANLVLPGTQVSQTLDASGQYSSQGKKEVGNKAVGEVQIYNFTKTPINLKSTTTTLTAGSKTYVLSQDVTALRPTAYKNKITKEIEASSLSAPVAVQASDGGESFNLPAGTRLEISNQVFGSKPQFLFAKTTTAITGGTSRYLSVVSAEDAITSQAELTDKIIKNLRSGLKTQGLALPDGAFNLQINKFLTDKPVGSQSPTFQASLNATVKGLAFSETQLKNLVLERVTKTLPDNGTLQTRNFNGSNILVKNLDVNAGLASSQVHFEGDDVFNVNLGNATSELVGKTQSQGIELLMSKGNIEKIDVTIVPSWQKSFPWFARKIHLNLVN